MHTISKTEKLVMALNTHIVDKEGFLRDLSDWTEDLALELAKQDDIELGSDHWEVIKIVRAYYQLYQISPVNRVLVNIIKKELGPEKGKSIFLMGLFSGKPAKLVAKIAGLPKPSNCD
ncbi:MAG: tRNA 2-thiouridine synthesizing protein E [Candidatus Azotimanducaceae bacterium]